MGFLGNDFQNGFTHCHLEISKYNNAIYIAEKNIFSACSIIAHIEVRVIWIYVNYNAFKTTALHCTNKTFHRGW